jgi:hypothetical protein
VSCENGSEIRIDDFEISRWLKIHLPMRYFIANACDVKEMKVVHLSTL